MALDPEVHKEKMKRIKAARDKIMATKTEEKGLIIVHTGNGKGKSSSGFGMIMRCIGNGMQCAVVQFIKGSMPSGERTLLKDRFSDVCAFHTMGEGFTWDTQDRDGDIAAAEATWSHAEKLLQDDSYHLVILDELTYMLTYKYLNEEMVLNALRNRPEEQSVVVTGRGGGEALRELVDTVSEIQDIKHAFKAGVKARRGVDF
jgi:cob(I)alamin adenosyltransferase